MKSIDILIPNHNTGSIIELCIESIRARTDYPCYSIIVHDESTQGTDRSYLEDAEVRGWIRLIRGTTRERWTADKAKWAPTGHPAPYWHGCALNVLVNEVCQADLAMILDADVFIKAQHSDWLQRMVDFIDDDVLVAAHEWLKIKHLTNVYVPGWWRPHFCIINMVAYRDGMTVDWRGGSARVTDEPYRTIFADIIAQEKPGSVGQCVGFDPGSSLWIKMTTDNPKGYRGRNLPLSIEDCYHHFSHGSLRTLRDEEQELVKAELATLRAT